MKLSMKPIYNFFAPTDGFAEFVVVVSLVAIITLAACHRLNDAFAAALTAVGGLGVVHDNCSCWLTNKLADRRDKE